MRRRRGGAPAETVGPATMAPPATAGAAASAGPGLSPPQGHAGAAMGAAVSWARCKGDAITATMSRLADSIRSGSVSTARSCRGGDGRGGLLGTLQGRCDYRDDVAVDGGRSCSGLGHSCWRTCASFGALPATGAAGGSMLLAESPGGRWAFVFGLGAFLLAHLCFIRCPACHWRGRRLHKDRGCSRPGCDAPAYHSEVHHVTPWTTTHRTDINDLTLACGPDNRLVEKGWKTRKNAKGDTEWLPPAHLDHGQPADRAG